MKKAIVLLFIFTAAVLSSCKEKSKDSLNVDRYAQYRVRVWEDPQESKRLAVLNKAEKVTLLETLTVTDKKGKSLEYARIRLADDKEGYISTRHLAKLPIFFIAEADAYERPTIGSRVMIQRPKATVAFIKEEKDGWAQVYIGKINDRYYTKVWVQKSAFDTDPIILRQALEYENALELLDAGNTDAALEKFEELREHQNVIGEAASEKYKEFTGEAGSEGIGNAPEEEPPADEPNENDDSHPGQAADPASSEEEQPASPN